MRILLGKMLALVLSALLPTISALAEDAPQATPSSEIDGFNFNFVYTGEFATSSGGLLSGDAYLDNIDMTLETDLESLLGWSNSKLMIYVLGNQGRSPSAFIGDTQGVSNIDAPDTWKLYELWYQRTWVQDKYSIRAGLYDYNSEFDVLETAGLFLNSSFGIGPDIAQSGENGPSIFPTTSLALRGRFTTDRNFYLQGVILDGVPGDPLNSHGTHIKLNSEDGLMLALEAGKILDEGAYKKIAVGSWRYSKNSVESAAGVAISGQKTGGFMRSQKRVYSTKTTSCRGSRASSATASLIVILTSSIAIWALALFIPAGFLKEIKISLGSQLPMLSVAINIVQKVQSLAANPKDENQLLKSPTEPNSRNGWPFRQTINM